MSKAGHGCDESCPDTAAHRALVGHDAAAPGPLAAEDMEPFYVEWVDSGAYLDECDHYGHQRAGFYAGIAAAVKHERERLGQYIHGRCGSLNPEDPYERGKDMAYLSVLQYLEPSTRTGEPDAS